MMRILTVLLLAASAYGQMTVNGSRSQTGDLDLSTGTLRPPERTVATLPAAAGVTGRVFIVTDLSVAGQCATGGGSVRGLCRSTGSAYESTIPAFASTNPSMDGTAAPGTGVTVARADHVHPTDTSRAASNAATTVNGTSCALGSSCTVTAVPSGTTTETKCFDIGADNAASDLVDADIGPQGRIFMLPVAGTIIEVTVAANAGTPSVILQKNHTGTATDLTSATLPTGAAGAVACAATGAACLDGTAKSAVTITTAGSANVFAAGDWIQTKTGSGFASSGAKRLSTCVTYTRAF